VHLAVELQAEEGWGGGDQNGFQEAHDGAGFDAGDLQPLAAALVEAAGEGAVPGKQQINQLAQLVSELHRVKLVSNGDDKRRT